MKDHSSLKQLSKLLQHQDTLHIAKNILGATLTTNIGGTRTSGIIVEVEAYIGVNDEAAHTFRGKTERTEVMFGPPGFAYVYFIYGMYYCVNIVTEESGVGSAILVRALEPVEGIETMQKRRKTEKLRALCSGPGKLCQAMGITRSENGESLFRSKRIFFSQFERAKSREVVETTRIGISKSKHLPWRFYLKNREEYVSKVLKH